MAFRYSICYPPIRFYWLVLFLRPTPFLRLRWPTEFSSILLGFTGFYWVLLGLTGFYWVLLGFTGFYWVSLGCTVKVESTWPDDEGDNGGLADQRWEDDTPSNRPLLFFSFLFFSFLFSRGGDDRNDACRPHRAARLKKKFLISQGGSFFVVSLSLESGSKPLGSSSLLQISK